MSKLETLTIEWFTLEEKLPETNNHILLQLTSGNIISDELVCLIDDKGRDYFILDNSLDIYYLDKIKYWAYCVEPTGVD